MDAETKRRLLDSLSVEDLKELVKRRRLNLADQASPPLKVPCAEVRFFQHFDLEVDCLQALPEVTQLRDWQTVQASTAWVTGDAADLALVSESSQFMYLSACQKAHYLQTAFR